MPQATSLAASILATTGNDCTLVAGERGIFDVSCDGNLVFSKHAEGRFPSDDEILKKLP
ncbi:MAG: Rdx family protein [Myxococcales bacterium]|nr:Rdx family protein [Myxococcales bacterium]